MTEGGYHFYLTLLCLLPFTSPSFQDTADVSYVVNFIIDSVGSFLEFEYTIFRIVDLISIEGLFFCKILSFCYFVSVLGLWR